MTNTLKTASLALAALVTLGAVASPAFAGSTKFDSGYYIAQLRYDGVNAIAADQVTDGIFRATVVSGGQQSFEFFDVDSLQQIKR